MLSVMSFIKKSNKYSSIHFCFFVIFSLIAPLSGRAETSRIPFKPKRVDNPHVRIDGHLNEEMWKRLLPLENWFQLTPNEGEEPSERTKMWLFYDQDAIYLGARLYTKNRSTIITRTLERDSYSPDQDAVALILDTFNDNRTAFGFIVSSAGVRTDIAIFDDAETGSKPWNVDWNAFWNGATQINRDGWSVEMRIPFSSLRFKTQKNSADMGLILWRYIARNIEYDIFPKIPNKWQSSAYKPSQALDVRFERIRTKHPVFLRPYILAGVEQRNVLDFPETSYSLKNQYQKDIGLDIKYNLTSNFILDATLNTDFAQVEADDQQINLTRFSLFFPEKRPFFQERADLFNFPIPVGGQKLFHSRTIGIIQGQSIPIIGGVRLTGRMGDWQIGFIEMQTAQAIIEEESVPSENFGVLRLKREIKKDGSFIGALITSRTDFSGNYNIIVGADADVSLKPPHAYLKFRLAQSAEPNADPSKSLMVAITLGSRIRRGFSYKVIARHIGKEFYPAMGYLYRGNINFLYNRLEYVWFPESSSSIHSHGFQNKIIGMWNSETSEFETIDNTLNWEALFRSGANMKINFKWMKENLKESFFIGNIEIKPDRYRFTYLDLTYESSSGFPLQAGFTGIGGGYYGGWQLGSTVFSSWTLSPHLTLQLDYIYRRVKAAGKIYEPHVARFRIRSAFHRALSLNAFIQYSSDLRQLSSNLRIRYNPSEGVDLYIVYNEGINTSLAHEPIPLPRTRGRSILLKYNYTFIH
jgi:hypothetical protein